MTDECKLVLISNFKDFKGPNYIFMKEKYEKERERELHNDGSSVNLSRKGSNSTSVIFDVESKIPISFGYISKEFKKPLSVQICGSFDKWQVRHPLSYDPLRNKWGVTLKIKKGTHYYKYIVDGEWSINEDDVTIKDSQGFINNIITV